MIDMLAASLGVNSSDPTFWMPLVFMGLLFLLIAGGVVLDGFDLGVGMLLPLAPAEERGRMMSLLSPWRDANEFWPLLGIGLFASAFPMAWGAVFGKLYGPLALMALGLALRSVSFEFRIRARSELKPRWVLGFWLGSVATAFAQGLILGRFATGYQTAAGYGWFAVLMGFCAVAAYALLGATWLVMRVDGELQRRAARWGRAAIRWTAVGMVATSAMLGLANAGIFYKWSNPSGLVVAAVVWGLMLLCFSNVEMRLSRIPGRAEQHSWLPFVLCVVLYWLMLAGLAYSLFPYLILDDMTLWDGTASIGSMRLVLAGAVIGAPVVVVFNLLAYRSVFGKERRAA
ncbi:cytochrome d ubiquinol oxidase subunit II [Bordetella petrii]|uniref:cytochrome d ubiquinol oxidase subunit II n=1 Tax=Bordetella petrii TaxID=94624 RepID=UPI0004790191|nr:cytochrome d ubiquinol oxidase subunit II [Bordetella petrii]